MAPWSWSGYSRLGGATRLASQARRQRRRGDALEQIGLECDELPLRRRAFGTRLRALYRRILDHVDTE